MPIMSERWANWPMHAEEMRERLGLGRKLPEGAVPPMLVQGYIVSVLSREVARRHAGHNGKAHRIMVECKHMGCARWLPFGRLWQHEKAHQRADARRAQTGGAA